MIETVSLRDGLYRNDPIGPSLLGIRCKKCGHIHFPAGTTCLACGSNELDDIELGSDASLFCETTVHMRTPHFPAGYSVGYVTLPSGVLVFSQLRRVDGKPFQVGMPMKLEIATMWQEDGKDVQAYRFYPA